MLTWCITVLDAERSEKDPEYKPKVPSNTLRQMTRIRRGFWTRPSNDPEFSKDTVYCLGWFRAMLSSSMLGEFSGNYFSRDKEHRTHLEYILGKTQAERFPMIGHTGGMHGSIFSAYTFPDTQSAVVTITNGRDYGDASEFTTQLLIQALFDLKPTVDLIPWARKEAELAASHYREEIERPWEKNRRTQEHERDPTFYVGEYRGFNGRFTMSVVARPYDRGQELSVICRMQKLGQGVEPKIAKHAQVAYS
ncbi:hypothetical protein BDW74DRAFT_173675 [Aspergillus multicolor]|uniref:uncharacterized protein n=1 Tax=Aspergillus multicolor TaxID=41759 RepID=UPI003CCD0002